MREILFRGKRFYDGERVEGGIYCGKFTWIVTTDSFGGFKYHMVDPSTVGQYTGLTDKNGKMAFEHDITKDQWGRKWIIFWCEGGFGACRETEWKNNSPIIYNALADAQNAEWFSKQHEIIGNIHDNPELLEEEPA